MPELNWDSFLKLPGAPENNFEQLCRIVVRRSYGRFGTFRARAQQPGVEFHLKLDTACTLGDRWAVVWLAMPLVRLGQRTNP